MTWRWAFRWIWTFWAWFAWNCSFRRIIICLTINTLLIACLRISSCFTFFTFKRTFFIWICSSRTINTFNSSRIRSFSCITFFTFSFIKILTTWTLLTWRWTFWRIWPNWTCGTFIFTFRRIIVGRAFNTMWWSLFIRVKSRITFYTWVISFIWILTCWAF